MRNSPVNIFFPSNFTFTTLYIVVGNGIVTFVITMTRGISTLFFPNLNNIGGIEIYFEQKFSFFRTKPFAESNKPLFYFYTRNFNKSKNTTILPKKYFHTRSFADFYYEKCENKMIWFKKKMLIQFLPFEFQYNSTYVFQTFFIEIKRNIW